MKTTTSPAVWENKSEFPSILEDITNKRARFSNVPSAGVSMKLFEKYVPLKVGDASLLSAVDENRKMCIELDDEQFEFVKSIEAMLESTFVAQLKLVEPKLANAEFQSTIKVSEQSGKKYLKTKVQLLGSSRTMGVGLNGKAVSNVPAALDTVGCKINAKIRIDGVYLSKERAGLVTKVDMFRVLSVPSEEDVEGAKEEKRQKLEEDRMKELMDL
jgi:hypothetical protein